MKSVHFIGIGGIGMSALSQWYVYKGWEVTGSDVLDSVVTQTLRGKGIKISITPDGDATMIEQTIERVIYSTAVPEEHPERAEARRRGTPQLSYPEALGEVTAQYKTIAICGTHGKSTTTAMTALVMNTAGLDPTVIVGTRLKEFGGNNFTIG